jgi:hypothetical protein
MIKKATVLNGSPRDGATTSGSLGGHLATLLRTYGVETRTHVISSSLRTKELSDDMMKDVNSSDLVVLSYPPSLDSPPSDVVRWMELIRDDELIDLEGKAFLAIGHCDEPDPAKLDVSIGILHNFSDSEGMRWLGGMRMPMGSAIDGTPLIAAGKKGRWAVKALDMAADALKKGETVPEDAVALMSHRPMRELSYVSRCNKRWKRLAVQKGTRMNLMDRPLLK